MNWLQKTSSPFEEHQLLYGPQFLEEEDHFDLPECPEVLLIIDIQEEFNKCINFDCGSFLQYLNKCSERGTEFHIVYDQLGDEPEMFRSMGSVYYAKSYGADPYEGVIDKYTDEKIDASEMEEDTLYFDPNAGLDIFWSSGHEFQHVYPDMEELIQNIKGKQISVVGGASNECFRDMIHWLDLNGVKYNILWKFVYG